MINSQQALKGHHGRQLCGHTTIVAFAPTF